MLHTMTQKGAEEMDQVSVKMNLTRLEELPEALRIALGGADIVRDGGYIYVRTGGKVLFCEAGEAGESVVRTLLEKEPKPPYPENPWKALLTGNARSAGTLPGLRDGVRRCLILFRIVPEQEKSLSMAIWNDLAPTESGDIATETAPGQIALIKQAEGHTEEDIAEFAAAVIETIDTETGIQMQAGIGNTTPEAGGLRESYRQACRAIEMGRRFQQEGPVYIYSRQIMERLISAIPEETRAQLRKELLSSGTEKRLNREMMETIRAFFRNDLNLSTTARQLFIHRNTLIYRLDKIRKETGFDLRRFPDAAAFQMISHIPEEPDNDHPDREK